MAIADKTNLTCEEPINRYEVVYGTLFTSRRIVFALSENDVYTHCQEKYPNIFPLQEINLLDEDIDINDYLKTT